MREVLDEYGLSPLKKFGQNFLIDDNILRRIADSADYESGCVLEIGAGLGALTQKLAERAQKVLVYEIDKGMCAALEKTLDGCGNITVIQGDVLKADIEGDTRAIFGGAPFFAAANLPYYITSPCIMRLLEGDLPLSGMVLMMQKEVARRLCAQPDSADYGSITAAVAFFAEPKMLFDVSRHCFYPQPDVDSTVVQINIKPYEADLKDAYLSLVKGLFAMRRKTVYNNLVMHMGMEKEKALALLDLARIDAQLRAETLAKEDFLRLAQTHLFLLEHPE
jgi:16S rRNA (adenine1518-N6/adenine1519-N6)-dimethyltransferase